MLRQILDIVPQRLWQITTIFIILGNMCMDPRLSRGTLEVSGTSTTDECQVTPVIHVLQYPGCVPKPIPSFACIGRCASYIQVSGSKIWQMERSCMCCQESGEREASVSLFCPKAKPGERKFIKVTTKAPLECMCRPCTGVEESAIIPQEIAGYADEGPLSNHFLKSHQQ
ncbi:bursicon [Aethina tumida]|uniref:bursicon n=1 Tax=Aethina tumida TaxID=116153 RepID=UPI00096B529B|nr:bursicon [Aethina tumida]